MCSQINGVYTANGNGLKRVIKQFGYQKRMVKKAYKKQPSKDRRYIRPTEISLTIDKDCEGILSGGYKVKYDMKNCILNFVGDSEKFWSKNNCSHV